MKLKLGLVFLVAAVLMVFGAFYIKDYMMLHNPVEPVVVNNATMEAIVVDKQAAFVDYSDAALSITPESLKPSPTTIFHFWASWCEPCVNEIPELIHFVEKQGAHKVPVQVVVVSMDFNQADLQKFLKSFPKLDQPPFVRIWDKNNYFAEKLNVDRLPSTVVWRNNRDLQVIHAVVNWNTFRLN